jgi:hypothetical protein
MQACWVLIFVLFKVSASPQIDFQPAASSSPDLVDPSSLSPAFLDSGVFCHSGTQDGFDTFDNSLIARTADNSEFPAASVDLWDLEDSQTIDDLWSSGSIGETDWPLDLTMYTGELNLDEKVTPSNAPATDICAAQKSPEEEKSDWQPPWVPIDPQHPDRDCLDDDWEMFCCPLNITPLAGTAGCVECELLCREVWQHLT